MIKTAAICLAALVLCSACILTKEDIDCWYEDMCMSLAGDAPSVAPPPHP
jgi:hypothetical protein